MSECVEIDPRISVTRNVPKPFVPMASLSEDSMLISSYESRSGSNGSKFQNGDTLLARITPCLENGKTGFVQFLPDDDAVALGSTEFIVLRSRTLTPEFVYCLARSDGVRNSAIKSMAGASGRQRVQEKCFDRIQIAHPPSILLEEFSSVVVPMFRLIQGLHERVDAVREVRDLVLPRLVGVNRVDLQAKPGSRA
jgi:type I restriction enzyme S subunit